jgi:ribosomal-protein-alanine N-acetyltransferase
LFPAPARLGREHVAAAARIDAASSPEPWTESQFEAELEKSHAHFWVVIDGNEVAAFGGFWLQGDWADIPNIAVHPGLRRRGHGKRLLGFLCEAARHLGARRITLDVRDNNAAARALYQSLGFAETSRRKKFYGGGTDAVLMEKTLS